MNFTIMINVGSWGGFYTSGGGSFRICLGWIALTIFPFDMDNVLYDIFKELPK